jgi:hypothetical protein
MTDQANVQATEAPIGWAVGQVVGRARQLGARLVEVFDACADSRAASALYQELSRLSDAELERRGISRGDLHRCVFEALSSPANSGGSIDNRVRA